MKLRPYQLEAENAAFREWEEVQSTLLVMGIGTGKTPTCAHIIKRFGKRAIFVAHRKELIFQARDKIEQFTDLHCEIEMGDLRASAETGLFKKTSVIVGSIQTLASGGDGGGRVTKFDPDDFDLAIIDEAHHAVSKSYRKLLDYLRQNPRLKILGVTATPDRADEEALGQVFDSVAYEYGLLDAIHDGYIVPIDQQMVNATIDFTGFKPSSNDLNGADLAAVMEAEKPVHEVASSLIEIVGSRRTLVFTASVNHARMLCEILNRHRSGSAAFVCDQTEDEDRARIVSEHRAGRIQYLCNFGIFTEGYDDSGIEVVAMARPTKSRALYEQMIRCARPLPGIVDGPSTVMGRRFAIAKSAKPFCLVIDYVGNSGKHKLITVADILGGNVSDEAVESAIEFAKKSGKPVRMTDMLDSEEERIQAEREQRRLEEEARKANLVAKAKYTSQPVDPFDLLQIKPATKTRAWDEGKTFTEKQAAFLRRNGIDPDTIQYNHGKQLMAAMGQRREAGLCTMGQLKTLKKYGIKTDGVTFEHAHKIIDAIAANGWCKPANLPTTESKPVMAVESENEPF